MKFEERMGAEKKEKHLPKPFRTWVGSSCFGLESQLESEGTFHWEIEARLRLDNMNTCWLLHQDNGLKTPGWKSRD